MSHYVCACADPACAKNGCRRMTGNRLYEFHDHVSSPPPAPLRAFLSPNPATDPMNDALRQLLSEANDKIAALTEEVGMLKAQRLLDNDDLARAYDMGRDKERSAAVAYLRNKAGAYTKSLWHAALVEAAEGIERGEHRNEEKG